MTNNYTYTGLKKGQLNVVSSGQGLGQSSITPTISFDQTDHTLRVDGDMLICGNIYTDGDSGGINVADLQAEVDLLKTIILSHPELKVLYEQEILMRKLKGKNNV